MAPQQRSTAPRERTDPTALRSALWLPIFDGLADPAVVARLAAEAEEVGWHGVFVWDHLRWRAPVRQVADPWITLAAIATATEHLRLGPMITPLARRRPSKVARETATLDRLSAWPPHPRRQSRQRPLRQRAVQDWRAAR
jgi:alkanesulfonate monooxygenase SsuD/methylene tetrahydromethanopterin reductase-like flavin-dependent oxidoreductase (luciferase family)